MRIYLDTNVFGAYPPDALWQELWANTLFQRIRAGRHTLVPSRTVATEIAKAPSAVQVLFVELTGNAEWLTVTGEAIALRDSYLTAAVVTNNHRDDALHVALATVAACDVLASWNSRQFNNKEAAYNQVNLAEGYATIEVLTPDTLLERDL